MNNSAKDETMSQTASVTAPSESSHRRIINEITARWPNGEPFAIWELRDACDISTSTVIRVMRTLVELRLVLHAKRGFQGRRYRIAPRWLNAKAVIENFEIAKAMGL